MKKYSLVLLVFIFTISCRSQQILSFDTPFDDLPSSNYYFKDTENYNDHIVGVWRWENGNEVFELTLQEFERQPELLSDNVYNDDIYGKYVYTVNGLVISQVDTIEPMPSHMVACNFRDPSWYRIIIKDIVSDTHKVGDFRIVGPNTAEVKLRVSGGIKVNYGNGQEWSLPDDMILIKQ